MSLKGLQTKWKRDLASIVEFLSPDDFKKMKFLLDKIPVSVKCDKIPVEMPDIIIQYYGVKSISVIEKVMKQIPNFDADVQDRLRPHVQKLKQLQQTEREKNKKAADAKSGAKKTQPAAGKKRKRDSVEGDKQPAADQKIKPDKKTTSLLKAKAAKLVKDSAQRKMKKLTVDPVTAVKPKWKKNVSLKPSGSTEASKVDPVAAVKPKKKEKKQDLTMNPFGSPESPKVDPVVAVKPKKKQAPKTPKIDPVSAVKPKQRKTQKQDVSLEASESTKTLKRDHIIGLHQANKTNKEIAETTGASVRYVQRVIKDWKESGEPSSSSKDPSAVSQILSEYESCWKEVSQQVGPLPRGLILQPAVDRRCDNNFYRKKAAVEFGQTFEILPTNTEVTLPPPDWRGREVWENDVDLIDSALSKERLSSVRIRFVNSVSDATLKQLLDGLFQEEVITQEEMESVRRTHPTRTDRARALIDLVTHKGASSVLIKILRRVDPYLSRNLKLSHV